MKHRKLKIESLERRWLLAQLHLTEADDHPINDTTTDYQEQPAVAMRNDGRYVVVWSSYAGEGGIYGKIVNADGSVAKEEFLVSNLTAGTQIQPDVAMDPVSGNFVVAWEHDAPPSGPNPGTSDVYARAFTSDGTPVGPQRLVNDAEGDHYAPAVAFTDSGDFVIAWDSFVPLSFSKVWARHFSIANETSSAAFEVTAGATGVAADVASAGDGSFAVTWESNDGNGRGIFLRRFNQDDTSSEEPALINLSTQGNQTAPAIAASDNGALVVVWSSAVGDATELQARQYLANGQPSEQEVRVDRAGIVVPFSPGAKQLASGGFIVAWTQLADGDAAREVVTRLFHADGTPVDDEQPLPLTSLGDQENPDLAIAGNSIVGAWAGVNSSGTDLDIFTRTLTIEANSPPSIAFENALLTLSENTTGQTKIADLIVTDDGAGVNSLDLTGPDAALFEIVGTTLFLKGGQTTDFESHPQLNVTVTVDDPTLGGTPDGQAALTIELTDVNEPPAVLLTSTITTVPENSTGQVKVADIQVMDDALGNRTLGLSGADAALFEIVGTSLLLNANQPIDFESHPQLQVTVTVDDPAVVGSPDGQDDLTIQVSNVNEPPILSLANVITALPENTSEQTKVATIVVTDDALGTNRLTLAGADALLFEILGSDLFVKASQTIDFETRSQLQVSVEVDDLASAATPDGQAALTIELTDVNDPPAVLLTSTVATIPENSTGQVKVADIQVTDDALGNRTLGLSGADADLFEIVGTSLLLNANQPLDFESHPQLRVTVTVDDPAVVGSPDGQADLTIQVSNVNEPPILSLANVITALPENTSEQTKVATIVVTDDALGTNRLSLAGADALLFEILGSDLFVKASQTIDFETRSQLQVSVEVDDLALAATPDDQVAVTLPVSDRNDSPTVRNTIATQSAMENVSFRFVVTSDTFADADAGTVLTYSATRDDGSALPAWLSFNSTTLTFSGRPTFVDEGSFVVLLRATDNGTPSLSNTTTFTINVQENPSPWQNPDNRFDIDASGEAIDPVPIDVLVLINFLNNHREVYQLEQPPSPFGPPPYIDPNGDNLVIPIDVLAVINFINRRAAENSPTNGEGEFSGLPTSDSAEWKLQSEVRPLVAPSSSAHNDLMRSVANDNCWLSVRELLFDSLTSELDNSRFTRPAPSVRPGLVESISVEAMRNSSTERILDELDDVLEALAADVVATGQATIERL